MNAITNQLPSCRPALQAALCNGAGTALQRRCRPDGNLHLHLQMDTSPEGTRTAGCVRSDMNTHSHTHTRTHAHTHNNKVKSKNKRNIRNPKPFLLWCGNCYTSCRMAMDWSEHSSLSSASTVAPRNRPEQRLRNSLSNAPFVEKGSELHNEDNRLVQVFVLWRLWQGLSIDSGRGLCTCTFQLLGLGAGNEVTGEKNAKRQTRNWHKLWAYAGLPWLALCWFTLC